MFKLKPRDQVNRHRVIFESPDAKTIYEDGGAEGPHDVKVGEIVEGLKGDRYEVLPGGQFVTRGGAIGGPTHLKVKPHVPRVPVPVRPIMPDRGSREEDSALLDDLFRKPKRGDTVVFPSGRRAKIESVSEGMVWLVNDPEKPIPVGDLAASDEPDTWIYTGDTIPK